MNPQDLEALKARVDEAEKGSRELDALIAEHFGDPAPWSYYGMGVSESSKEEVWVYWSTEGGGWWMWGPKGWRMAFESEERARKCTPDGKMYNHPPAGASKIIREASKDCLRYTTSVDAALALIEAKLPGWGFSVTTKAGWSWACVNEPDAKVEIVRGEAKTPALALCSALLAALIAKDEKLAKEKEI
jgi:hypothetical protein